MTAEKYIILFLLIIASSFFSYGQCPSFIDSESNGNGNITLFYPSNSPNNLASIFIDVTNFDNTNGAPITVHRPTMPNYQSIASGFDPIIFTGSVTLNFSDGITEECIFALGVLQNATPVDLIRWDGDLKATDIELRWSTAWEENNAGFEIERSFDGRRFETIGMVEGVGNSTLENHYSYTDQEIKTKALGETAYYRLVQIDYNGSRTTSRVIAIDLELEYSDFEITKVTQVGIGERRISVYYYNPPSVRKINVLLTNIQGHILLQSSLYPDAGINSLDINLSTDPGHLIFLSMDNGRKLIQEKILLISQQ